MFEIAGKQLKICILSQGSYRHIRKARMPSLGHGCIGNPARQPGGLRIEWQDAVFETRYQTIEPALQPLGALHAA